MSITENLNTAPSWVSPVMRVGYSARAATYVILGALTVLAAWTGGQAEGTSSALGQLRGTSWGVPVLWAVAVGLFAYALWRLIAAHYDLELHGSGLKGIVARGGLIVTGLIHVGLGVSAARQAMGGGEGGDSVQSLASWLMQQGEWGKWAVATVGLVTIAAGIYYVFKGFRESYKRHLRETRLSRKLDPAVKVGLVAHGIVIAIIGIFLAYAGWNADPSQAGGMGKAFEAVRNQPFGRFLLAGLGLGLIAFAVYCVVEAVYRIIPRCSSGSIHTLAGNFSTAWERRLKRFA